jgi:hypothetical protein
MVLASARLRGIHVRHFEYYQGGECLSNAHWLGPWRQHLMTNYGLRQNHRKIIGKTKKSALCVPYSVTLGCLWYFSGSYIPINRHYLCWQRPFISHGHFDHLKQNEVNWTVTSFLLTIAVQNDMVIRYSCFSLDWIQLIKYNLGNMLFSKLFCPEKIDSLICWNIIMQG